MFSAVAPDARYRAGLATAFVAVPLIVFLAVLWPSLNEIWLHSYAYSHGYLVLALSVWLAFREFRRAPVAALEPSWLGLAALSAAALFALAAIAGDVNVGEQLAVPALLYTALWGVAGSVTARRFFWPAAYLIFGMSVWGYINEPLRGLTTAVAGGLTRSIGIPAYIGANEIHVPAGTFAVEGGCSGLHYFIAAAALSVFYGLTSYRRWRARFIVLGAALVAALFANWVRVFTVVVVGQLSHMQSPLVRHHYVFGWVLFFVVLAPVFMIARRFEPAEAQPPWSGQQRAPGRARAGPARFAIVGICFAVLLSGAVLAFAANRPAAPAGGVSVPPVAFPPVLDGWTYAGPWAGPDLPHYVGADRVGAATYRHDGDAVHVYIARYAAQRQGAELINYANSPAGPHATVLERHAVRAGGAPTVPAVELRVRQQGRGQRLLRYRYDVAGWPTTSPLAAKLYQVLGRLRQRSGASVLVLSAACDPDCAAAGAALSAFARKAAPAIMRGADDHK